MGDERWGVAVIRYMQVQMLDRGRREVQLHRNLSRPDRLDDIRETPFRTLLAPCTHEERVEIVRSLVNFLKDRNPE